MSKLNQSAIKAHRNSVTGNMCLQELDRELKMREINYPKWCIGNYKKQQEFERQIAMLQKIRNQLSVMKKKEWEKLEERFQLRETARNAEQKTLF
ncbi:MAG: hypothetical protein ACI9LN_003585 [Saprospiraceae bacterium]|jgi:hypothetical protein